VSKSSFVSKNLVKSFTINRAAKLAYLIKIDKNYMDKIKNMKSQDEFLDLIQDIYLNPHKKIKQLENIHNSLINLSHEFRELDRLDETQKKLLLESASALMIANKNGRFPNPDDCFKNCQAQHNISVTSAWNQFLAYSAGCAFASPGILTFFACEAVAGIVYDIQYWAAVDSFGVCFNGCDYPEVRPH
jgi:hypothetical protein